MKYEDLLLMLGREVFFDLPTLVQLSGESKTNLRNQLHRWMKSGKCLSLRRGFYMLAPAYQKEAPNPAQLANYLYKPSYLSGAWALSFYGLIPEKVVLYTSVTTRSPSRFENDLGIFDYRNIKQEAFFGYRSTQIESKKVFLATPEKALLDYWHHHSRDWSKARMEAMRFQNSEVIDPEKLKDYAERFNSPRLINASQVWITTTQTEQTGTIEL